MKVKATVKVAAVAVAVAASLVIDVVVVAVEVDRNKQQNFHLRHRENIWMHLRSLAFYNSFLIFIFFGCSQTTV